MEQPGLSSWLRPVSQALRMAGQLQRAGKSTREVVKYLQLHLRFPAGFQFRQLEVFKRLVKDADTGAEARPRGRPPPLVKADVLLDFSTFLIGLLHKGVHLTREL